VIAAHTQRSHLSVAAAMLTLAFFSGWGVQGAEAMDALREKDRERIRQEFRDLTGEVKMVMFTQEMECQYCVQTRQMLEVLDSLSDKLELSVFDFVHNPEEVEKYGVDKIPATVLMGQEDVGIRYYGVPAGYELAALVETIKHLSADTTDLGDESREKLEALFDDVHIQVFVTPSCPYCPGAATTAYKLAQESPHIRADVVEAIEFPHLANRYGVRGVPMVVIDDTTSFVGNRPESFFVEQIMKATEQANEEEGK
jgi:glutaredoxin-like protein